MLFIILALEYFPAVELNSGTFSFSPSFLVSSSIRWSATNVCLKAAPGRTAPQETCGPTRRPTGASTPSFAISRAVGRPSSPHTASKFMFAFTPRRNRLSAMCKAVKKPLTHYTGKPKHSLSLIFFFQRGCEKYDSQNKFACPFLPIISLLKRKDRVFYTILVNLMTWKLDFNLTSWLSTPAYPNRVNYLFNRDNIGSLAASQWYKCCCGYMTISSDGFSGFFLFKEYCNK